MTSRMAVAFYKQALSFGLFSGKARAARGHFKPVIINTWNQRSLGRALFVSVKF
jgi:hypothetical protein